MEEFFDEEEQEIETMRQGRKSTTSREFARLINKKELSQFEMDELFM